MADSFDVIILGGGCAGLSLAMRLAAAGPLKQRVLLLEQRARYRHDRHWCFWESAVSESWPVQASQRWSRFEVRLDHRRIEHESAAEPYALIESGRFYAQALSVLHRHPRLQLRRGLTVAGSLRVGRRGLLVPTSQGVFEAPYVIDTRAERPRPGLGIWQSFLGYEIEVDAPLFDPKVATLMDFEPQSTSGLAFLYLLPRSRTRALLEWTVFDRNPQPAEGLRGDLERAMAQRIGGQTARISYRESGILPMTVASPTPPLTATLGRIRCGLDRGMARPSSGYAFSRIQAWADQCALRIRAGDPPCPPMADAPWIKAMDQQFLAWLGQNPADGARRLYGLFEKTPTDRLVRFLAGRARPLDGLAVAAALGGCLPCKPP